jgi:hypothetical protein
MTSTRFCGSTDRVAHCEDAASLINKCQVLCDLRQLSCCSNVWGRFRRHSTLFKLLSDGRRRTTLTQLGIPVSSLAIHSVVKMASFWLPFEGSHTPAGQEPAESRHGVAVATISPYVYKQLHIPELEKSRQFRDHFLQQLQMRTGT